MRKAAARRGFTLIELLVVIAIVAILAGVLLPALAATRPRSQQVLCLNNIKQLTFADIVYSNEYGQSVPDRDASGLSGMWMINLSAFYFHATNVFLCPVTSNPQPSGSSIGNAVMPWARTENNSSYFCSYIINGWLYASADGDYGAGDTLPNGLPGNTGYFTTAASIKFPSKTPAFTDGIWADGWPTETDQGYYNTYTGAEGHKSYEMQRYCIARHACDPFAPNTWPTTWTTRQPPPVGAVNVGLFDGHAEFSTLPNLWSYYWHNNWNVSKVRIGIATTTN